jgi:hypothetical protein
VLAECDINVEREVLDTKGEVGYALLDINKVLRPGLVSALEAIPHTIRFRALY